MKTLLYTFLFVLFATLAFGQVTATHDAHQINEPQAPIATVYIYRLRVLAASKRKMTLSVDGEQFAYLQNGRYWAVKLSPGEHVIADKNPNDHIKFSVSPGAVYYVRCEFVENGSG